MNSLMKDMIQEFHCLNCESEINSESNVVFCDETCLNEYISDHNDLERFLSKNAMKEMDL